MRPSIVAEARAGSAQGASGQNSPDLLTRAILRLKRMLGRFAGAALEPSHSVVANWPENHGDAVVCIETSFH